MRYPEDRGTRIVNADPSPVQDEPPGPPDAGVRVDLPPGSVEGLVVGPKDFLVIRVPAGTSDWFTADLVRDRPDGLRGGWWLWSASRSRC